MRTTPDFYLQKDNTIIAFSQAVKPKGKLIYGFDYFKQCWITKGKKMIEKYLKAGKKIKVVNT